MRPLPTLQDVRAASGDDDLCLWAAQEPFQAWALGDAVAVVAPELVRYNRVILHGPAAQARTLAEKLTPDGYRLLGRSTLMKPAYADDPAWDLASWSWMAATGIRPPGEAAWLPREARDEVEDLLRLAFPDSYTWPGMPQPTRWAGIRDHEGRLVATAADGPSSTAVGLLGGVAVHPAARGQGLAARICGFVTREQAARYDRVSLMVDDWNTQAIGIYGKRGFAERFAVTAAIPAPPQPSTFTQ